jgi:hypothetical protein
MAKLFQQAGMAGYSQIFQLPPRYCGLFQQGRAVVSVRIVPAAIAHPAHSVRTEIVPVAFTTA